MSSFPLSAVHYVHVVFMEKCLLALLKISWLGKNLFFGHNVSTFFKWVVFVLTSFKTFDDRDCIWVFQNKNWSQGSG